MNLFCIIKPNNPLYPKNFGLIDIKQEFCKRKRVR